MAFNFPDNPGAYETVTNTVTGSQYQWRDDLSKWVVIVSNTDVTDIIYEGDTPPGPLEDFKLWYSTDTLELYFWYVDANGTGAWLPTSAPTSTVDIVTADIAALNTQVAGLTSSIENAVDFEDFKQRLIAALK